LYSKELKKIPLPEKPEAEAGKVIGGHPAITGANDFD
jgi:hypothetical protein